MKILTMPDAHAFFGTRRFSRSCALETAASCESEVRA